MVASVVTRDRICTNRDDQPLDLKKKGLMDVLQ